MTNELDFAPPLQISTWLNTPAPICLQSLRGRVVLLHAFQMLCPGCVMHSVPQISQVRQLFPDEALMVIGIHTVFEHHAVMNVDALRVFVQEYRLTYPIGVDQSSEYDDIPLTMQSYRLRGTPSLMLIDRAGTLRVNHFGRMEDLQLGALIGQLLAEAAPEH
jgi:thiol-disulfide isomerase/thioredoxin